MIKAFFIRRSIEFMAITALMIGLFLSVEPKEEVKREEFRRDFVQRLEEDPQDARRWAKLILRKPEGLRTNYEKIAANEVLELAKLEKYSNILTGIQ